MEAKVTWEKRLTFQGTDDAGRAMRLDSSRDVGGDDSGFKPVDLFAVSLAGCTAMDVISILQKKRQDVTAFEVQVHAKRTTEHPKVISHAVIEYFITGHMILREAVERAIELSATHYCPAEAMLVKIFPIEHKYHIFEDEGTKGKKLVMDGEFNPVPGK